MRTHLPTDWEELRRLAGEAPPPGRETAGYLITVRRSPARFVERFRGAVLAARALALLREHEDRPRGAWARLVGPGATPAERLAAGLGSGADLRWHSIRVAGPSEVVLELELSAYPVSGLDRLRALALALGAVSMEERRRAG